MNDNNRLVWSYPGATNDDDETMDDGPPLQRSATNRLIRVSTIGF